MKSPLSYHSYLIRIWEYQDLEEDSQPWSGEVTHIQTGETREFNTLEGLLETIQGNIYMSTKEVEVSEKVLQVNFKFKVSGEEYIQAVTPLAGAVAAVPGLEWKVWILNEDESEAGGIYLFKDGTSLEAYLNSEIVEGILNHPALSDFNVKSFDVMPEQSEVTRAPLESLAV